MSDDAGLKVAPGVGSAKYGPFYMLGLAAIGQFFLRLADPKSTPLPMMVRL